MAENTPGNQRGRPFEKGKSGNPAGKPPGSRHKTTLAMEALLDGEAENITRKAIEMAKGGDGLALRLCMDRLLPARKSRPVALKLSTVEKASDIPKVMGEVLAALARGEIDPDDATAIAGVLDAHRRTIETADVLARLDRLEREPKP